MKDIHSEDRRMARKLARRIVNALHEKTNGCKVGSREEFQECLLSGEAGASK